MRRLIIRKYAGNKKRLDSCWNSNYLSSEKQREKSSNQSTANPLEDIWSYKSASMNSAQGQRPWWHWGSHSPFSPVYSTQPKCIFCSQNSSIQRWDEPQMWKHWVGRTERVTRWPWSNQNKCKIQSFANSEPSQQQNTCWYCDPEIFQPSLPGLKNLASYIMQLWPKMSLLQTTLERNRNGGDARVS